MIFLGGGKRHRGDERANGLRVTCDGGESQRRQNLSKAHVDEEQPADRRALHALDQRAGLLLQPVALEEPNDRQHDVEHGDVAVLVEAVAERREHLQERHPAEQAGNDRRGGNHQQWIESQREPDDDQGNAEQRPVVDHASPLPNPPPPGVSITKRSPGCISAEAVALSISAVPSMRSTQFRPACPSAPPLIPRGATRRRLARMFARIRSRNVTARITPSPPVCFPGPPEPRRMANWSRRTGRRFSRISGSVSRLLVMCVWTALVPSWSGPAPEPPAIVS